MLKLSGMVKEAREKIKEVAQRGKTPIVVGGTGLYVSSLLDNIEFIEEATDQELRNSLEEKFDKIGAEQMLKELNDF